MKKRFRVTARGDFQRALKGPTRFYSGRALVAFALQRESAGSRIGVTVSRRLKGAVRRNRARRRLRELARLRLLGPGGLSADDPGLDLILIARPAAGTLPFAELESEARLLLQRLGQR